MLFCNSYCKFFCPLIYFFKDIFWWVHNVPRTNLGKVAGHLEVVGWLFYCWFTINQDNCCSIPWCNKSSLPLTMTELHVLKQGFMETILYAQFVECGQRNFVQYIIFPYLDWYVLGNRRVAKSWYPGYWGTFPRIINIEEHL